MLWFPNIVRNDPCPNPDDPMWEHVTEAMFPLYRITFHSGAEISSVSGAEYTSFVFPLHRWSKTLIQWYH